MIGFDIETHDDDRHDGLNQFMGVNPKTRKKSAKSSLVFDIRRTTVTGFSIYADGSPNMYYVNLAHADVENRLDWETEARTLLDARRPESFLVAHNAPFELTMMGESLGYEIERIICSLQLCVTAYGPDEFDMNKFVNHSIDPIKRVLERDIKKHFLKFDGNPTYLQQEVINKVISKQSTAAHNYNGWIADLAYGYGLKKAVKSWFGHQMGTYEDTLQGKAHMGQLTGEETAYYGAEDAFWCLQLYHKMIGYIQHTNPKLINTFFQQENPMVHVFSQAQRAGLKVNRAKILDTQNVEREKFAETLYAMRQVLRKELEREDWTTRPLVEEMVKREHKWYPKHAKKLRQELKNWALQPKQASSFDECRLTRASVGNHWAAEKGKPEPKRFSLLYYHTIRVLLYDVLQLPIRKTKNGTLASDGDARGVLRENCDKDSAAYAVLEYLNELSGIDQRIKLYITNYLLLTDPETSRLYPTFSSQLATRRMASTNPNPMQLGKKADGAVIRSFFIADNDEYFIVSNDWSQIELVTIAQLSQDPIFLECYQTLPYEDLHSIASAQVLDLTLEDYKAAKKLPADTTEWVPPNNPDRTIDFTNRVGNKLTPAKWFKEMRNDLGKGANFEYWYSGALSSTGDKMGWSGDLMWEKTELYREKFKKAEEWRRGRQEFGVQHSYVELPDGHRRVRWEVTDKWFEQWMNKWVATNSPQMVTFGNHVGKKIRNRGKNQLVNAMIQGTNATLTKRSIVGINAAIKQTGIRARFMCPIHDEILYCVHKDDIIPYLEMSKRIMCHHPDIFPDVILDATASIGYTFEPFSEDKAPLGQFELDEAQECDFLDENRWGEKLNEVEISTVIKYMENKRNELRSQGVAI